MDKRIDFGETVVYIAGNGKVIVWIRTPKGGWVPAVEFQPEEMEQVVQAWMKMKEV